MKWPLFKNKIKDELSAHRSEVDVDALWSAIEPQVDALNRTKRKKRRGLIWLLFAGVLLAGSTAGYFFLGNSKTHKNVVVENNFDQNKHALNDQQIAIEKPEKIDTAINYEINKAGNEKGGAEGFKNNKAKLSELTEDKSDLKLNKNKEGNSVGKNLGKKDISVNNVENKTIVKADNLINAVSENEAANNFIDKPQKINQVANAEAIPFLRIKKIGKANAPSPKVKVPETKAIEDEAKSELIGSEEEEPIIAYRRKNIRFSIGLNGGFSYANRTLESKNTASEDLFGQRERYEKQLETSHLGVQLTAEHESGFSLTSGLQFTRMVELYERNEVVEIMDTVIGVAYYSVLPNNDTVPVMGEVPHLTINTLRKRYYNKYTMLDIPLLAGFRYENNNWTIGGQAGVFANISINTEGRILMDEIEEQELKEIIKTNIGLSYYAGLSVGYLLNENIEISVSPYGRYFSKSFTKDDYGLSQKYLLVGLDARFRYWF